MTGARLRGFTLLVYGGALARISSGDALLRYVRPVARPLVMTAGGVIVVLAIVLLTRRDDPAPHEHRPARLDWLVALPVVALLVVGAPQLGAYSTNRRPMTVARPATTDFPPLPRGDPVAMKVSDFAVRSVWGAGDTLRGRTVSLTGFVAKRGRSGFELARLVITCCAADASALVVDVNGVPAPVAVNRWVVVTGSYAGVRSTASHVPMLNAISVLETHAPADPYE